MPIDLWEGLKSASTVSNDASTVVNRTFLDKPFRLHAPDGVRDFEGGQMTAVAMVGENYSIDRKSVV